LRPGENIRVSESASHPNVVVRHHRLRRMSGRGPHEPHRVATPLELLFDMTFVIAFGVADPDLGRVLRRRRGDDAGGVGLRRMRVPEPTARSGRVGPKQKSRSPSILVSTTGTSAASAAISTTSAGRKRPLSLRLLAGKFPANSRRIARQPIFCQPRHIVSSPAADEPQIQKVTIG
jgi:hypothetical protein